MHRKSQFSAEASLMGYFYQCRLALLEALKRIRVEPTVIIAIETLDDVVFEQNGSPLEIIQAKHHLSRTANITNTSSDLWKTIRIWCDLLTKGIIEDNTTLYLMTTAIASKGSAAHYLRTTGRNTSTAEQKLLQIVKKSKNKSNELGYNKFNSLTKEQRLYLLERIYIIDNSPNIQDIQSDLLKELWGYCERQYLKLLLEYLEGWWFQKIVTAINGGTQLNTVNNILPHVNPIQKNSTQILGEEIEAKLNALREEFKASSLPVHPDVEKENPDVTPHLNSVFAKQLSLIKVSERRIQFAAKDYYKAATQRSRWIRESLLVNDELEQYDATLHEEWARRFEQEQDSLCDNPTPEDKITYGKNIYKWVENNQHIPIRPSFHQIFMARGSYQILANRLQLGWHPDFRSLLGGDDEKMGK